MGIVAWNWIAIGAIMGLLTVMIALGIGRKRGTWLHGFRLALWAIVVGGAGASLGCSEQETKDQKDAGDPQAEQDAGDPTSDWDGISCYVPDPGEIGVETIEPSPDADAIESYDSCYIDVAIPDTDTQDAVEVEVEDTEEEG